MSAAGPPDLSRAVAASLEVVTAADAFSVPDGGSRRKWDGAWWHLAALVEMDQAAAIPAVAVERAARQLRDGAWPRFVIDAGDVPQTADDRLKMDCCHCELGVYWHVLAACGCDVDRVLPWIRPWFLRHQLPDGGLNCEPAAYRDGGSRKSSMVSTLPPLEAILWHTPGDFTAEETRFLDAGARYLIEHRLACAMGDGHVINPEWLKPFLPRFFEYDVLQGCATWWPGPSAWGGRSPSTSWQRDWSGCAPFSTTTAW